MAGRDRDEELLERVDVDRRRFIGRIMVGSALATPVVSSFSMRGVNAVFAQDTNVSGEVGGTGAEQSTTTTTVANTTTTTAGNTTTTTVGNTTTTTAGNTTTTTAGDLTVN